MTYFFNTKAWPRIRRAAFLAISAIVCLPAFAWAQPTLKIINFTADWCPNCQILNPRIDKAIETLPDGTVQRIDLDMTKAGRRSNFVDTQEAVAQAKATSIEHNVRYLWDWYGGITGLAVIVAADTGEPISCIMRPMSQKDIQGRIRLASKLVEGAPEGQRKPQGPDCPPPTNQ